MLSLLLAHIVLASTHDESACSAGVDVVTYAICCGIYSSRMRDWCKAGRAAPHHVIKVPVLRIDLSIDVARDLHR